MSVAVNLSRALQLSSHIHNMCSEAREAIYTRESDVKHWLDKGQWSSYLCLSMKLGYTVFAVQTKYLSVLLSLYLSLVPPECVHTLCCLCPDVRYLPNTPCFASLFLSSELFPLHFNGMTPCIISFLLVIRL